MTYLTAFIKTQQKVLQFSACVFFLSFATEVTAQQSGKNSPLDLVKELQGGGLNLYLRHAATNHKQVDTNVTDLTRCDLQRNLSEQGKAETQSMAEAIDRYKIPVGRVLTSPYCRTIDTAQIAFGRYEVVQDLRATFFTNEEETRQIDAALRELLSQVPSEGVNTVIVGHTANLDSVTDVWPKPEGVAHVFRPMGEGGFEHLGRLAPSDWEDLLAAQ